jgi:hypothetical protein
MLLHQRSCRSATLSVPGSLELVEAGEEGATGVARRA